MKSKDEGWVNIVKINPDAEIMRSSDRTRVYQIPGGWLCKFHHFHGASSSMTAQSITFIPDPQHEWDPLEEQAKWERIHKNRSSNFTNYTDRIEVFKGWVYKDCFFIRQREMHISLVYVPEQ